MALLSGLALTASQPARAQELAGGAAEPHTQPTPEVVAGQPLPVSGLQFNFMPGLWLPRLSGTSTFGPSSTATELDNRFDLELDDSEPVFVADFAVRRNQQWQIKAGGFSFSTDSRGAIDQAANFGGLSLLPGDAFSASFDMVSFDIEATYWWTAIPDRTGCGTQLLLGPTAGFRYVDVDMSVEQIGIGREDTGGEWVAPYLGAEFELRWGCKDRLKYIQQIQIAAGGALGAALGGDGGSMAQLHADLTVMFTPNFGAFFGYKLVDLDAENDDYQLNGGLEGLYFGATLRF